MTVLRSRKVLPTNPTPKPTNIEPVTPSQTSEPATFKTPNSGTIRRRSVRIASKSSVSSDGDCVSSPNDAKMKRKLDVSDDLEGGGENERFSSVRSVKKVAKKTRVENGGDELVNVKETEGKGKRKLVEKGVNLSFEVEAEDLTGDAVRSFKGRKEKEVSEEVTVRKSKRTQNGNEGGSEKRRRIFSREEKGKAKFVDEGLASNGSDLVEMGLKCEFKSSEDIEVLDAKKSEGIVLGKTKVRISEISIERPTRRFTREEKGKAAIVEPSNGNGAVELGLECEVKSSSPVDIAVPDASKESVAGSTNAKVNNSRMEQFKNAARRNASRFAYFSPQEEEEENHLPSENEEEEVEVEKEIEDWPGPFSTAMKIIRDRADKLGGLQGNNSKDIIKTIPITWIPKARQDRDCSKPAVPSLKDLCLKVLAKNADAITSLDTVPDALRHNLSHMLCDSRAINAHFFNLLLSGSPSEIRLRDCSWLTEEEFSKSFEGCDTSNLMVLQLDRCGRCMPDYILLSTLARSSNNLPSLTTLSLCGACRLSDVGFKALVSAAPALRSINLSQCSLLTPASIDILADSLGSVLRELYINDCQNIDAMLILPALKKLKYLEVLSVAGIETVTDDFISELTGALGHNMKELVLTDCVKLTDSSLKVIAEACPGLCTLDISNLCKLTDFAIGYLANGCRAIQTLKLCRNAFSDEAIAAFLETSGESLKELSLNNVKKVSNHTATSLARRSKNLLSLDLSWCRCLSDEAVGLIVDNCLSLRMLKLFGCSQITNVFLDGHSNKEVKIVGLKMSEVLEHLKLPDPLEGPLRYSSVLSSM